MQQRPGGLTVALWSQCCNLHRPLLDPNDEIFRHSVDNDWVTRLRLNGLESDRCISSTNSPAWSVGNDRRDTKSRRRVEVSIGIDGPDKDGSMTCYCT